MIYKRLTGILSNALCAAALCAALCAATPRAQGQAGPATNPPPPPPKVVLQVEPPAAAPTPKPPPPPPSKVVQGATVPAGWQKYEFGEPRLFSVALPAKHEVETEVVKLGPKLFAPGYTYSGETDDGTYIAYYMEKLPIDAARMPEKYKNDFYEGVWKGLVDGIRQEMEKNGILLQLESGESRPAKVSGLDARDQDFTLGPVGGRVRMVLSGSRIFLALLMEDSEKPVSAAGLAFLNSLEVYTPPR